MEALGVAASVAGILSFAGQAIAGVVKLRDLFQGCADASKSVNKFLNHLNLLIRTLEDVKGIVARLQNESDSIMDSVLASLQIQIEDCSKDIYRWVQKAGESHPDFTCGTKRTFKSFLVAINKENAQEIYSELKRHRDNITTQLSIVGRSLDIEHASQLKSMKSTLNEVNNSTKFTVEALENLQTSYGPSTQYEVGSDASHASLVSLAESLSRIENFLGSNHSPYHGSNAGSLGSAASNNGSYGTPRRPQNRDEFDGPHQLLPVPPPEYIAAQHRDLPHLPTNLSVTEQDIILNNVYDRLSQCAFDFVAKYEFPIPIELKMRIVERPEDREWTEWVYLLKRLASKRRIPVRLLHKGQIKQLVIVLENSLEMRHSAKFQSRPLKDDWNILQLISAGIQVAQILKDASAMDYLERLYAVTEKQTQERKHSTSTRWNVETEPSLRDVGESKFQKYYQRSILHIANLNPGQPLFTLPLSKYIDLVSLHIVTKAQAAMFEKVPWCFSTATNGTQRLQIQDDLSLTIFELENEIRTARHSCWQSGVNVDEIYKAFLSGAAGILNGNSHLSPVQNSFDDDSHIVMQGALQNQIDAHVWATKQDRINLWLLQNLRSSSDEAALHQATVKGYCQKQGMMEDRNFDLDDNQWERLVLKYWFLDEAAVGLEEGGASTNGAVDSKSITHDMGMEWEPTTSRPTERSVD